MWHSLRVRLSLIFIGLAIIPLIAVGIFLGGSTYAADKSEAITLQSQVSLSASAKVTEYFKGLNQNLLDMGDQIRSMSVPDPSLYQSIILNELNFGPNRNDYEEITLVNPQGYEIVRATHQGLVPNGQLLSHSTSDDFLQPLNTHQTYYSLAAGSTDSGEPYLIISMPLYEPGGERTARLNNILIGKIRLSQLATLLTQIRPIAGETLYLTDASGKVIAHQDPSFDFRNKSIVVPPTADIQPGLSGTNAVVAVNRIQLGNQTFNVVAEQPADIALKLMNNLISALIIATLIALLGSIVVGFIVVRSIVLPVEQLAVTAQQVAAGDLSQTTSIRSDDEIGTLANTFNNMTSQLRNLVGSLEKRVAERTEELERQALRMRASAEVARDAASAPSLDELLDRSSRLIRDRFNLYHTGIFLLDDKKEYAILRASPTEAGAQMLESGHRLRVGEQGIVGQVAATGEPRIALDVGADAVYFSNPLLPNTHSEMALPLKTAEGIIGILDIQSDQPSAFHQDDITIMQVMADQLATAIERIRLLQQVQAQLREIEGAYGRFTQESWKGLSRSGNRVSGYKFDSVRLQPVMDPLANDGESAVIPIRLRGQTIGAINVRFQHGQPQEKIITLIEQLSDRLATALENARLLEETRQRAERDALISEMTGRFRSTLDLESVLRTAAQELQRAFQLQEAEVRLNLPATKQPEPEKAMQEKTRKNGKRRE